MILKDIKITVNSVDLSSSLRALTMTDGQALVDDTTHGATWESVEAGLRNGGCSVQLKQDFSSGGVDDVITALLDGSEFAVVIQPTTGSVGPSNPSFTYTAVVGSYERFSGQVGEVAFCTVDLPNAGATGIVRATA